MGAICQPCYNQELEEEGDIVQKTQVIRLGAEMNGLTFNLSTCSLSKFTSQCIVIYADHCSELSASAVINKLHSKARRKLFEHLALAEEQTQKKNQSHSLARITIPHLKYNNLLFVKLRQWDGKSQARIEQKIYSLTKSYLEVFSLRKITTLTIIEPDLCLGVHYTVFYAALMKSLKQYCKSTKRVTIIFNTGESMKYFVKQIKQKNSFKDELQATIHPRDKKDIKQISMEKQGKKKRQERQKMMLI